jgi:uncharacterized membrane protein
MKISIIIALIGIVVSLLAAGLFMVRGGPTKRMANALTWRIGLSVALFLSIIFAYSMGWIQPTGIPMGA